MPLTFAETPLYYRDSQGQYHRVLSGADMTGYRTAAAQDAIDAGFAKTNEVGIVINGKRPSMAVTAGQYVIVRNSTISGIADGLYTANAALSPSTDVTAANLTAVSGGGLNDVLGIAKSNVMLPLSANTTATLYHNRPVLIYSDRGGLWATGTAQRGLFELVPTTFSMTVTVDDAQHLTIANTSTAGVVIMVISFGNFYFTTN